MICKNKNNGKNLPIIKESQEIFHRSNQILKNREQHKKTILEERAVTNSDSTKLLLNQPTQALVKSSCTNPFLRSKLKILLKQQANSEEQSVGAKICQNDGQLSTFKKQAKSHSRIRESKLKDLRQQLGEQENLRA